MTLTQAIILGAVQGMTEFLPISSSGHLVIFQHLFGLREPALVFDTALHFGTLIALFAVFRADVGRLISSCGRLALPKNITRIPQLYRNEEETRMLLLILAGTIPTVCLGLFFKDLFESLFSSMRVVSFTLLITAAILWLTKYFQNTTRGVLQMTLLSAIIIGLAQGFAITPGISRSGATIAVALFLGVERETSGRFSFLLSMPAITGATLLNLSDARLSAAEGITLCAGTAAAIVTGYISLVFLLKVIKKGAFYLFAPYCCLAGATALALWLLAP